MHIISSATSKPESEQTVADGILRSAYLTSYQRSALHGIIESAMPDKVGKPVSELAKSKPGKTMMDIGVVHYPGTSYKDYPKDKKSKSRR